MIELTEEIRHIMFGGWCERETMDYDEKKFEQIVQQIYSNQKLRELVERQKINTKAVLSADSPNKEELQRLLNLFDYLLEDSKK